MNLDKRYETIDGIKCNILQMVGLEPEWAANRIQEGEKAEAALATKEEGLAELREFIRVVTLHLQDSRSKTAEQNDNMFQRAYKLYVKFDVENKQTALRAAVEKGEEG